MRHVALWQNEQPWPEPILPIQCTEWARDLGHMPHLACRYGLYHFA